MSLFFASASALANYFRWFLIADDAMILKSFSSAAFIAILYIFGNPPFAVAKFINDLYVCALLVFELFN
jgi:hypothetical protein